MHRRAFVAVTFWIADRQVVTWGITEKVPWPPTEDDLKRAGLVVVRGSCDRLLMDAEKIVDFTITSLTWCGSVVDGD